MTTTHRNLSCTVVSGGCDVVRSDAPGSAIYLSPNTIGGETAYAGKTVCIPAGTYAAFGIYRVRGTETHPMTITNCGGQVIFDVTANSAMRIEDTSFVHLTGTGSTAHLYGIVAYASGANAGHVVEIKSGTTDMEIDFLEAKGVTVNPLSSTVATQLTGGVGIAFRSYPSCIVEGPWSAGSWVAENFVQKNTKIHNCYVHDVGFEGMYVGPSHYGSLTINGQVAGFTCASGTALAGNTLHEAPLDGVEIYDNLIERVGSDGLQVGAAVNGATVVRNTILDYGLKSRTTDSAGIMINPGTTGLFEQNWVKTSQARETTGIASDAGGNTTIRNNVVIGGKYGIIMLRNSDYNMQITPRKIKVYHNTVVSTSTTAFIYYCSNFAPGQLILENNLFSGYALGEKNDDDYFKVASPPPIPPPPPPPHCVDTLSKNKFYPALSTALFENASAHNYHLLPASPAKNTGSNLSGIVDLDFDGQSRLGSPYDFGAFLAE